MPESFQDVIDLVTSMVEQLVDLPEEVKVVGEQRSSSELIIEIQVDESDIGKVIGRQGRIIKALRTLARAAASQHGFHVEVELSE